MYLNVLWRRFQLYFHKLNSVFLGSSVYLHTLVHFLLFTWVFWVYIRRFMFLMHSSCSSSHASVKKFYFITLESLGKLIVNKNILACYYLCYRSLIFIFLVMRSARWLRPLGKELLDGSTVVNPRPEYVHVGIQTEDPTLSGPMSAGRLSGSYREFKFRSDRHNCWYAQPPMKSMRKRKRK